MPTAKIKNYFKKMRGTSRTLKKQSLIDIFWSWLGGFFGIYAIWFVNDLIGIQPYANLYLIGSFGASAVLVYGIPAGEMSQPKNLVGGHIVSALSGVITYKFIYWHLPLAAALAVSIAIAGMLLTHTTHPPGGATALIAVIGGPSIHKLGFMYILSPVLIGVIIMLLVAVIVNNFSSNENRNYPKHWF